MKVNIGHLKFNTESKEELLELYRQCILNHGKMVTVTPNLDIFRVTYQDKEKRKYFNSADISTIDGKPILWIAKWLKIKQSFQKISGSDLAMDVLEVINNESATLYLFGGKKGIAEKAKQKITESFPNIKVVGCLCPEFGYERDDAICLQYVNEINNAHPDVVFLCTGAPKTEGFLYKYSSKLQNSCYFSVGATIDFIAGNIKRAPKWMSKIGLEWLYRLSKDFKRLFKRYWLDGLFLIKIWFLCHFKRKERQSLYENDID